MPFSRFDSRVLMQVGSHDLAYYLTLGAFMVSDALVEPYSHCRLIRMPQFDTLALLDSVA